MQPEDDLQSNEDKLFKRDLSNQKMRKLHVQNGSSASRALYNRKRRLDQDSHEEGGSVEVKSRNTQPLQTKFTCTDGDRIESENKRSQLLALETKWFIKNKK